MNECSFYLLVTTMQGFRSWLLMLPTAAVAMGGACGYEGPRRVMANVSDQLSNELSSLRIDRSERTGPSGGSSGGGQALRVVVALALVGVLVVGSVLVYPRIEAAIFKTEVTTASVTLVSPVQASIQVTSTGYVVPQQASNVGAKVPGRVRAVHVREGDTVEAGALLVELENADVLASIAAAESRVSSARANVAVAYATLQELRVQIDRDKPLVEAGALPRANLENLLARKRTLQASLVATQTNVKAAQKEVGTLRVSAADLRVSAPISGTVVSKPVEVGELVGAGVPAVRLANFASMLVETDVPEGRLHMIKLGTPCEVVLDAYPTKRYRGEAVELGKHVDRAKATIVIKVKLLDDAAGVLPDMSARVSFLRQALSKEASEQPAKLVVPKNVVIERDGNRVLFALQDGVARRYIVQLGEPVGAGVELIDGPPAGTRVITNPPATLRDGQSIKQKEN